MISLHYVFFFDFSMQKISMFEEVMINDCLFFFLSNGITIPHQDLPLDRHRKRDENPPIAVSDTDQPPAIHSIIFLSIRSTLGVAWKGGKGMGREEGSIGITRPPQWQLTPRSYHECKKRTTWDEINRWKGRRREGGGGEWLTAPLGVSHSIRLMKIEVRTTIEEWSAESKWTNEEG